MLNWYGFQVENAAQIEVLHVGIWINSLESTGTCITALQETVEKLVQIVGLSKCSPNPQQTNFLLSSDYQISGINISSCQYAQYNIISYFFIIPLPSYFLHHTSSRASSNIHYGPT